MDNIQITALLLILGTGLIYTGFGAFPPRIYTEQNVQEKLNLLAAQPRRWILSQSFVIMGGIAAMAGSVFLISLFRESQTALLVRISVVGFVFGHVFWIWHVGLRTALPQKFAKNELPGWLFKIYSIPTLLALAGFGIAFLAAGSSPGARRRAIFRGTVGSAIVLKVQRHATLHILCDDANHRYCTPVLRPDRYSISLFCIYPINQIKEISDVNQTIQTIKKIMKAANRMHVALYRRSRGKIRQQDGLFTCAADHNPWAKIRKVIHKSSRLHRGRTRFSGIGFQQAV